jgi:hypothetical protein
MLEASYSRNGFPPYGDDAVTCISEKAHREMLWENQMLLIYSLVSKIRKAAGSMR